MIMYNSKQIAFQITYLQVQKLLKLWWRSSSEWGCNCVAFCFAYKGCQSDDYG
jgi:hypothetical protein